MEQQKIEIYDRDKRDVVLELVNGDHLVFPPQMAVQVAQAMIDAASNCGFVVSVQVPRRQVSKAVRDRLVLRVTHVLQSLRGRKDIHVAATLTDIVLSEVTQ